MSAASDVDGYIQQFDGDISNRLKNIRQIVRGLAPTAQEKLSYGMPYYNLNGRLVYFAVFDHHIGFYPMPSAIVAFQDDLAGYVHAKGSVQFPHARPLPTGLIKRMVKFRVEENEAKKVRTV